MTSLMNKIIFSSLNNIYGISIKANSVQRNMKMIPLAKLISEHTSVTPHHMIDSNDAESQAVDLLKDGNVIAVPTDTVYGLACSAADASAIKKLYSIKCRNSNKPLAICLGQVEHIKHWAEVNHVPEDMLSALLPGPVTIILRCKDISNEFLVSSGKIGIRIPDHPFLRNVTNKLRYPLALTSANTSGEPSSVTIDQFRPLWNEVSAVFNGGQLGTPESSNDAASTVVDLSERGFYTIIRSGNAENRISKILKKYNLKRH